MKKCKPAALLEHDEQARVIQWRDAHLDLCPKLWLLYANPNGGKRNIRVAKKLKKEGTLPGVCDLFLPVARKGYHGLYIEMKRVNASPSDTSEAQKRFIEGVIAEGFCAFVCYGHEDAIETILSYMGLIE